MKEQQLEHSETMENEAPKGSANGWENKESSILMAHKNDPWTKSSWKKGEPVSKEAFAEYQTLGNRFRKRTPEEEARYQEMRDTKLGEPGVRNQASYLKDLRRWRREDPEFNERYFFGVKPMSEEEEAEFDRQYLESADEADSDQFYMDNPEELDAAIRANPDNMKLRRLKQKQLFMARDLAGLKKK